MKQVEISEGVVFGGDQLGLIAGPCVIEDESTMMQAAEAVKTVAEKFDMPVVFKSSFAKDNRGNASSYYGPGREEGLALLRKISEQFGMPVLSDVHGMEDIEIAKDTLDIIQIPAYLCQQTALVQAAAKTGKTINVKKGQFLAPETMDSAVGKIEDAGNQKILLTERGSCFGYNRLVSDIRCVPIMQELGYPVVYDAGHIVRIYGVSSSDPSGGERQFIPYLVRAGVAAGANALFVETHPNPLEAKCDAVSQVPIPWLEGLLEGAQAVYAAVKDRPVTGWTPFPEKA